MDEITKDFGLGHHRIDVNTNKFIESVTSLWPGLSVCLFDRSVGLSVIIF